MTDVAVMAAIRALFPTLMALSSLALVPLIRLWRGPQRDDAATYATFGVQLLLLITAVGAALAGAGYLSTLKIGQIAIDPSSGQLITINILQETTQVMRNIGAVLKAAGMDYGHIVKTTIFLKDMDQFAAVNDVYGQFFSQDFPARETVQVSRLSKDVNVEISVIACLD